MVRAIGGHLLSSSDEAANRACGERFAVRLMRACGARRRDELDGRAIEVLFDAPFLRGNAVGVRCGNAAAYTCAYHAWTYASDGRLVGVPNYQDACAEELDKEQWGLVPVRGWNGTPA